ncbi:MAG: hypothetical protein PVG63_06095 [Anaerolineales bacterium]
MMKKSSQPQGGKANDRCPNCGYTFPAISSAANSADGLCPACGQYPHGRVNPPDVEDELTDEWLEGEQASVRSRRFYGEPRFH